MSQYDQFKIGDQVTVKVREEGYGSNYRPTDYPVFFLEPGTIGTIGAVKVPYVSRRFERINGRKHYITPVYFVCVDWWCPATSRTERAGVAYANLVKIKEPEHV